MRLLTKHVFLFFFFATFASIAFAQKLKPIPALVLDHHKHGASFQQVAPFEATGATDKAASFFAPKAQFLQLDPGVSAEIAREKPQTITLELPFRGQMLHVELVKSTLHTDDFSVLTSVSNNQPVSYEQGAHYRGILKGDDASLAAVSFFTDGEVMGMVSNPQFGNLVLGKLDLRGNFDRYILYSDQEVEAPSPVVCHTPDKLDLDIKDINAGATPEVTGCVRMFLEADYELFQNKVTVQGTVNYLSGAYNQVATLYSNETISTTLSQVFVWVTPDAYDISNAGTVLDQFRTTRVSFNGNIAHLTGIGGNNLGGIGYIDVLCFTGYNYSYSDINTSYSNVPTYSWTVEVMTHEIGHNLGSNHTHWCGWTGGALDNCYTTEGGCAAGPAPTNGGTIMSYCHLTASGINLSNGFGTQPGDLVRARVSGSACLAATCTQNTCTAPTALTISSITSNGAQVGWTAVTGASSYTLRYRPVGGATWVTVSNAANPYTMTGLVSADDYEVTVQSVCATGSSDYLTGMVFTTLAAGGGSTCNAPTNLAVSTPSSSSAAVSWTAATGATSYSLQYKTTASTTWSSPVNVTSTNYTITGLTASTSYNVQVQTVCSSGASTFAAATFTTPAATSCGAPASLSATSTSTTTASVSWTAVTGATNYQLSFKPTSSSTWSSPLTITGTSGSLSGLTANTSYDVRVATNCNGTLSAYATASFATQAQATCGTPTISSATATSSSSASIVWSAVTGATNYLFSYKTSTATTWSTAVSTTSTSYNLTGLVASTTYNVRVQTNCNGSTSAYATANVTTSAAACNAPGTPTASSITSTSATISWTAASGASSYVLNYKKTADATWGADIAVTSTSRSLTGLTASTSYDVRVKTVCGTSSSAYSTSSFTTAAGCSIPTGLAVSSVAATSATVTWTAVTGATSYTLQYKKSTNSSWTTISNITGTTRQITGLVKSTTYNVKVRSNCTGSTSSYSATVNFTTPAAMGAWGGQTEATEATEGESVSEERDELELPNFDNLENFSLAPNPANTFVSVGLRFSAETNASVSLLDLFGRTIEREEVTLQEGAVSFALGQLPQGVYLVRVMEGTEVKAVRRLVKN